MTIAATAPAPTPHRVPRSRPSIGEVLSTEVSERQRAAATPGRPIAVLITLLRMPGSRLKARWWTFGLLAYVPLLFMDPGKVESDTKSYLYLDPSRLLA